MGWSRAQNKLMAYTHHRVKLKLASAESVFVLICNLSRDQRMVLCCIMNKYVSTMRLTNYLYMPWIRNIITFLAQQVLARASH